VLTDEGRSALEQARRDYATIVDAIRQTLDPEKQVLLRELLKHLSAAIMHDGFLATEAASAKVAQNDGMSPAA
jgi:hypothetical protein